MLGFAELRGFPGDLGDRVDKILRIELVTATIALIPAGRGVTAQRAGAFNIAIREGVPGFRIEGNRGGVHHHVTVIPAHLKHLLHNPLVINRGGAGEQIVGKPERHEVLHNNAIITVREFFRGNSLRVGRNQNRGPVFIGTRDHEDILPHHAHIAREHIRGNTESSNVTNMARAVGIRPGNSGENMSHGHHSTSVPARAPASAPASPRLNYKGAAPPLR